MTSTLRALALATSLAPAAALAAPCALEVRGDAAGAWAIEIDDARRRLARLAEPNDCAAVRLTIEATAPGATLLFRTHAGREAARRVLEPRELASTLEALLVTLAPPPLLSPTAPSPVAPPPPARDERRPRDAAGKPSSALRLALLTGTRVATFPGVYLGPSFRLEAASAHGAWELVASLESTPVHLALTEAPSGYALATHALGFGVLHRRDLGAFTLAYGAQAGLYILAMHADPITGGLAAERMLEKWQPRIGAIGAMSVPLGETLALRVALHVDGAIAKFSDPGAAARELPSFPRLGATLFFGVEAGLR